MWQDLGLKETTFNNILTTLRKSNILSKENKLIPILNIKPDYINQSNICYNLIYRFVYKEDELSKNT